MMTERLLRLRLLWAGGFPLTPSSSARQHAALLRCRPLWSCHTAPTVLTSNCAFAPTGGHQCAAGAQGRAHGTGGDHWLPRPAAHRQPGGGQAGNAALACAAVVHKHGTWQSLHLLMRAFKHGTQGSSHDSHIPPPSILLLLLRLPHAQSRPAIFDLEIRCPDVLYDTVVECDEQVVLPLGDAPST